MDSDRQRRLNAWNNANFAQFNAIDDNANDLRNAANNGNKKEALKAIRNLNRAIIRLKLAITDFPEDTDK